MDSLLEIYSKVYKNKKQYNWQYYNNSYVNPNYDKAIDEGLEIFGSQQTNSFIQSIFQRGLKSELAKIFDELSDERSLHVASVFFMGHFLAKKLVIFNELFNYKSKTNVTRFDFSWFWFLCALYHDAFFDKEKIDNNNSNYTSNYSYASASRGLLYDKTTIEKYDIFRKTNGRNDHGIHAASELTKNYSSLESTPDNYQSNILVTEESKECICKIAKVIACHNIFICLSDKDKNEYTKAGLQNLIPSVTDSCKMPQSKGFFELLYLLLCICDVLEPTKRNINLNQLQLSTKDKNQIIIRFESNADNTVIANYNNYIKNIIDAECWLNYIKVNYSKSDNKYRINILFCND